SRYERDFAEYERIGKGGYGEVFRVENRLDGIQYAVKKIALDALLNELRTLARLDHPNIVRYFGGWLDMFPSDTTGLTSHATTVPVLTLHVQMSLYPLTLTDFLSYNSQFPDSRHVSMPSLSRQYQGLRHCFHTLMSLLVFLALLDGVEYLHSQGLVHRDLKPANIFVSLSDRLSSSPSSIDRSRCRGCLSSDDFDKTPIYMNFRIGDFGLVAALASEGSLPESAQQTPRAVGTEHYRPRSATVGVADEKLDIFALGVILFELLWPFGTRMERHETLSRLKGGELPERFVETIGSGGGDIGKAIVEMVS
ncbi:kinase-like protein, partial [Rhizodiscina lignyota]